MNYDAHIRLWRLWNELNMRPLAMADAFHLWRQSEAEKREAGK